MKLILLINIIFFLNACEEIPNKNISCSKTIKELNLIYQNNNDDDYPTYFDADYKILNCSEFYQDSDISHYFFYQDELYAGVYIEDSAL